MPKPVIIKREGKIGPGYKASIEYSVATPNANSGNTSERQRARAYLDQEEAAKRAVELNGGLTGGTPITALAFNSDQTVVD